MRFENAFTCQPVCGPARACLQTGKYATEVGCHTNHRLLPPDEKTIAHRLAEQGYATAYFGKWHLASCGPRGGRTPFFLFVSYIEPHHQNDHGHYEGPRGARERFKDFVVPGDLVGTDGDWRDEYPDYLGCVRSLDDNVGRIHAALEELGLADDTLLIYTSDHGSHFRTRNAEYKRSCHNGCIRIPLIINGPGFQGGRVPRELTSLIDLPPTILPAAGAPADGMRGHALQRLLSGTTDGWPEEVFLQISESQCGRAIRTRQWTYSVRAPNAAGNEPASDVYVEDCLYDLEADPHQRTNRVADPELRAVRAGLRETLLRRLREAGEAPPRIVSRADPDAHEVPHRDGSQP